MNGKLGYVVLVFVVLESCTNLGNKSGPIRFGKDWPTYGGNKSGNRYSPLTQINLSNVKDLQLAWTYDSNDPPDSAHRSHGSAHEIQCQPIVIRGVLYGISATLKLFALNAATGKQLWKFDPFANSKPHLHQSRGVVYWENGDDKRILYTAGTSLYAVNASTGKAIATFGNNGKVDLREGLSINYDVSNASVSATSPGAVYKNVFILGSTVSERGDAPPGYVRGFNVVTGKLLWTFHTIPQPGELGFDTWPKDAYKLFGAVNNWSGLVIDDKRGAVYFGTGAPAADFYGGDRAGKNLFSDCIVSLSATTGKLNWYYQTIHHDLWDRDIPCLPSLATIRHNGRFEDVVVQATKDGLVYVLNRDNGTSIFPVEERPVDTTNSLPGEHPWPIQKFPLKPLPFTNQTFDDSDITNISSEAHDYVKKLVSKYDYGKKFLLPNTKGTINFGYSGGAEWGGNAVDSNGILYQPGNNAPWLLQMISDAERRKEVASFSPGQGMYISNCSSCHGMDRKGDGKEFPNLVNMGSRLSRDQIGTIVKMGRGQMPSFLSLSDHQRNEIIDYLLDVKPKQDYLLDVKPKQDMAAQGQKHVRGTSPQMEPHKGFPYDPPYVNKVWEKVVDQEGYPGVKPPWGTISAINLNTGDYLWTVSLGEYPELVKKGIPPTGTEIFGGPVVTAGDLIFIAGTRDEKIRALDKKTGKIVWQYQLPAGGFATPATYEVNGVQYVVIAAGGARGLKPGGTYIAFALPEKDR